MLIFLARPFQGEKPDGSVNYYLNEIAEIKKAIKKAIPCAKIYDPCEVYLSGGRNALYDKKTEIGRARGKDVYKRSLEIAGAADVLVAYLPEASMGTADEIASAGRNGRLVLCIDERSALPLTVLSYVNDMSDIYSSVEQFVAKVSTVAVVEKLQRMGRKIDQAMVEKGNPADCDQAPALRSSIHSV